jgi:CHAT domain-containing protein
VRGALRLGNAAPAADFKADPKAPFAHPYFWAPFILMGNWQ